MQAPIQVAIPDPNVAPSNYCSIMSDHLVDAPDSSLQGHVAQAWVYPVKSMQGVRTDHLHITATGITGDRHWGIVDQASGKVLSAKREPALLDATVDPSGSLITLGDGTTVATDDATVDAVLSAWLGRPVTLQATSHSTGLSYEMTFDPPDDNAEVFAIPVPPGTFVDLAPLHLVTSATLAGCASARPDLDFDVRRFRPNLVLDIDVAPFTEDSWAGRTIVIGEVELAITQPTVRCAMPLRAQPATAAGDPALARRPDLHQALNELNPVFPNHLGVYAEVVTGGTVRTGDMVRSAGGS
jgi:uncharacterized protein YcbX